MFISRNSPWSIKCDTPTCVYHLLSCWFHLYSLVSDRVLSSFHTSTESIAESSWVYIHTTQYCAVLICTTLYLTLHWVHTRPHVMYIALISFVAPVTVQYWCVLTIINILSGFIRFILSLSARTNKSFPILHDTAQYSKARACSRARNRKHQNEQEFERELERELFARARSLSVG